MVRHLSEAQSLDGQEGHPELHLHDRTIQGLYGIGLKLEYCMTLVDESPEQAKVGLDAAIAALTEVIVDLRSRIDAIR